MVVASFINALLNTYICHPAYLGECTRLKKRCRVKSINDGQCDTMELWEDGRGKFGPGFHFSIFKICACV